MGIPQKPVEERVRELQAEAQRRLLMGDANAAVHLQAEANQIEMEAAAAARRAAGLPEGRF